MTYDPKFHLASNNAGLNFVSNQLEYNLAAFIDYCILYAGGFINVKANVGNTNVHGIQHDKLYPVNDPNYKDGQVWQTMRKNWVYESGIGGAGLYSGGYSSHGNTSPYTITGIILDETGKISNTAVGTYSHVKDYKNGRIIFNTKISTNTSLRLSYAYKWVQVYTYADAEWWQELQYATDENGKHHKTKDKGDFFVDPKNRVQLPAVVLEIVPRSSSTPYRMGDQSMVLDQDVLIHIVADNYYDRNNITDMIRLQEDRVIKMYDINTVAKSGAYTYNIDGTLNSLRKDYSELVNDNTYFYNTCRLKNMVVSTVESPNPDLFESTIRTTAEIIIV